MKNVGESRNILKTSARLKGCLEALGQAEPVGAGRIVFHTGDKNLGVFLVCKGKVCLRVEGLPQLDRTFPAGSLLGLPATFTASEYSLTAVCVTDSEVIRVPAEEFLRLMQEQPDLCREANDMLSREVLFIHSAMAQRMRALSPSDGTSRKPVVTKLRA